MNARTNSLLAGFAVLLATAFLLPSAKGQVTVDISLKRNAFLAYEPLLINVRITNLSGQRLLLSDVADKKWFSFDIQTLDGRPIPPRDPNYQIAPIQVDPGNVIERTVNLTELYPLGDFGSYRIRASIYVAELSAYFASQPETVEITEGKVIWEQTVGVPGGDGVAESTRDITLLTQQFTERTTLYLRIQDPQAGIIYCTHRLGDYISYGTPDVMLDVQNVVHVLQNTAPREFVYSVVGLDGKIIQRQSYSSPRDRPHLVKSPDGSVMVQGGILFDPNATPTPGIISKLSERPVSLDQPLPALSPVPSTTPGKKKKGAASSSPTPVKKPTPKPVPAGGID